MGNVLTPKKRQQRKVAVWGIGVMLLIASLWQVPRYWCGREAGLWYEGDPALQNSLAQGVARWINDDLDIHRFPTGSDHFNGEWLFGTYMMAGMGFAQMAMEHPKDRQVYLELVEQCIEQLLSPQVRQFDRQIWNDDPLDSFDSDHGHAAYLGYLNLLLSLHRQLDPRSPYAILNREITATLARRVELSSSGLLETYPGEIYPVDNCAVIASIAIYSRASRGTYQDVVTQWVTRCRQHWIDPKTGLLFQAMTPVGDKPLDEPRGSGSALGAYFLSFADVSLSRDLYEAVKERLATSLVGFGVVREYPWEVSGLSGGKADIDSGPLILGYSISATGFSLAGSRVHNDPSFFTRFYRTAYLFGTPLDRNETRTFVTGGPLGNAILLAMLTAQPTPTADQDEGGA